MQKHIVAISGAAVALLGSVASTHAEVKLTDNLSIYGYAAGSATVSKDELSTQTPPAAWVDATGPETSSHFDVDAVVVGLNYKFDKITAKTSMYYKTSGTAEEYKLLDVNLTYDLGNGSSITGGKFLSWLGFEPFHAVDANYISAGMTTSSSIPGYHSGLKYTFTNSEWSYGVAVLDEEFTGTKGDGELRNNYGLESFVTYTGIKDVTVFAGLGYQGGSDSDKTYVWDFWTSYQLTADLSVAAEYTCLVNNSDWSSTVSSEESQHSWLAHVKYKLSDKLNLAARVSSTSYDEELSPLNSSWTGAGHGFEVAIAPTYAVTANLDIRAEIGYGTAKAQSDKANVVSARVESTHTFAGVQAIFKF